jgi:cytochrome c556
VSHDETQKDKAQALKNGKGLRGKRKKLSRTILDKLKYIFNTPVPQTAKTRGIPMKAFTLAAVAATLLSLAAPASAQFAKAEDAIKYRQSALFVMGQHFGRIGAMASGRAPFDAKVAADNADVVASMAKLPWAAFGAGTDKGGNTKANPEIWTEQAKFKDASDKLVAESGKLAAAAKTGNLDAVKTAFTATAASCKACHDAYRAK